MLDPAHDPDGLRTDVDVDVDVGVAVDAARAEADADGSAVPPPDVWVDLDGGDDEPTGAGLRYLKVLAVIGVAGWLIAMIATVLSPSNVLDTTDLDENAIDDEPAPIPADEELGIGGGVVGRANPAQVLRVQGADEDGGVVAVDPDAAPTDAGGGEAGTGGDAGRGDPTAMADPDSATADPADGTAAAGSGTAGGDASGSGEAAPSPAPATSTGGSATTGDYRSNLAMIREASVRNRNHDGSAFRDTPSDQLVLNQLYGPRSEYLGNPGGSPEQAFPVAQGGQFRTACEFSHFAYDDPLVFPGQAGAAHLHMFFGNTDVNAHSTYETLIDSGSSTCNGMELNRTGYWVPALFDDRGNVRVPDRVVVYYKGEGQARGNSQIYPDGAAMIANDNYNAMPVAQGGVGGQKLTFQCSDNFSTNTGQGGQTMAACDGSMFSSPGRWTVLEVNIKFPTCWNGQDPSDWANFRPGVSGGWYGSNCQGEFNRTLPNLEYFVNYRVDPGENTANWFLSSDVDPTSFGASKGTGGSTSHGDWWGGWNAQVNQMWIDNCVNQAGGGCGFGYLTNGGGNGSAPVDGPALKMRPQYDGPHKVPASELMAQLCPNPRRSYAKPEDAAYCQPG